jgi:hypothetical protein
MRTLITSLVGLAAFVLVPAAGARTGAQLVADWGRGVIYKISSRG